jgi:hypothetical protein
VFTWRELPAVIPHAHAEDRRLRGRLVAIREVEIALPLVADKGRGCRPVGANISETKREMIIYLI